MKGKIITIDNFFMPQLNRNRNIRIYLPPNYEESTERHSVMYMHDAQELYADAEHNLSWGVAQTLDSMLGLDKNIIVVGVDNESHYRLDEYSPWKCEDFDTRLSTKDKGKFSNIVNETGGQGFLYLQFLVETLKPYIDQNYRTLTDRENTAICGSSMGAFISLVAAFAHPQIFGKVAAFSTAAWFNEPELIKLIRENGTNSEMKLYMDIGTNESSYDEILYFPEIYLSSNKNIVTALKEVGFKDNLTFKVIEGGKHSKKDWKMRFPEMLKVLY